MELITKFNRIICFVNHTLNLDVTSLPLNLDDPACFDLNSYFNTVRDTKMTAVWFTHTCWSNFLIIQSLLNKFQTKHFISIQFIYSQIHIHVLPRYSLILLFCIVWRQNIYNISQISTACLKGFSADKNWYIKKSSLKDVDVWLLKRIKIKNFHVHLDSSKILDYKWNMLTKQVIGSQVKIWSPGA